MKEWAIVKEHVAADITLLCDRHHREKTNGLLGVQAVRDADASPVNRRGESEPYPFHVQRSTITIKVGNNGFWYDQSNVTPSMVILSIDAEPVLWFNLEDDNLLLNLTLYDRNNKVVLKVRDNEMAYSTEVWDVTFIGQRLIIKSTAGAIALSLKVSPNDNVIAIEKAELRYNGYEVFIDEEDGINMPASLNGISACRVKGSGHLINYGNNGSGGFNFPGERSYKVG